MSNFKHFPKSKTSCPLKPWLVDFIFNYDSNHSVTANAVKIIENINEDKNGNVMKLVSDGNVHIKANITHQSIASCIQENDDDMPPWDKALILMRKYSLSFQPKPELENCEFILIVEEFKLWDLQTGFDFKKTIHPCSDIARVKMKIRENWLRWRESIEPVNDEPSSIGDSMGSQLLSLLAQMGQETLPEDSQPDQPQSVIDSASTSEAILSIDNADIAPDINGPTLISDNPSISDSQRQPFLQYIDNRDNQDKSHQNIPGSQSQQYEEYEFSSPSEVSLEFSCESSDDSSTENKMAPKPQNDSTSDNIRQDINSSVGIASDSGIPIACGIPTGDKPEIHENVANNVEASVNDEISIMGGEENSNLCQNNNKQALCGSKIGPNLSEKERTHANFNSEIDSGQKGYLLNYVKYLKACSASSNLSKTQQNNIGLSNTDNSKADFQTNGSVDNGCENNCLTNQNNDDKSLQDSSESQIYTNLVENEYDSIQWWSSAEDNSCLSNDEQDKPEECDKTSDNGTITGSDKNETHKASKCDKHNKTPKHSKRSRKNKTTKKNCKTDLQKKSDYSEEPEHKSTPERDKILECVNNQERDKKSESRTSDILNPITDIEDNVTATQPFSVNSSEEFLEPIGDTTCVELNYKQNVSKMQVDDNENEPLLYEPDRNSDSVSTREPSDEILNSNSNNSCVIIHKSDSSCYEISEFESKNSSDSTKKNLNPVQCDTPKSGNLSIYQSTQKTASKKEVPLFPLSPVKDTEQPSTSKDKAKESVESLVFDTEYEEELRLRELAKPIPKIIIKLNDKHKLKSGNVLNESGTKNNVIENKHVDNDKSDHEKLSKKSVSSSDKASNSDLLLIQAAQSAEKNIPLKIPEKHLNSSKCQIIRTSAIVNPSSSKALNFQQTQKEISDKHPETVHQPQEKNSVESSVLDSNQNLTESVIIIGSSESSSTNSNESHNSESVISFSTSQGKRKPETKVLAADTESNIITESQDIPTSEVNNSILNRNSMCGTSTSSASQNDHSIINLSDLSDTSSEEREEPHTPSNQQLKDVLYERLRKRKRKLSMGKTSFVEIGEPSSKRKRCIIPEQQIVGVDVDMSQNQNVLEHSRTSSHTSTCDSRISIEQSKNITPSASKSSAISDKCFNLKNKHQIVPTDYNCIRTLLNNNNQPRSNSSKCIKEVGQPKSSNSRSIIEIDQPSSSNIRSDIVNDQPQSSTSKSVIETGQPMSTSNRSIVEIDQPSSSNIRSDIVNDQPQSSTSKSVIEIDKPRSSSNRSIDQPRSSSSRSNMVHDQPRSSCNSIKEMSDDRNWWDLSNESVNINNKPSTSKDERNDPRLPECAIRNVPQCFEELFEEPTSELQQKLYDFKIPLENLDCIHKYIHK